MNQITIKYILLLKKIKIYNILYFLKKYSNRFILLYYFENFFFF